MKKLILVLLLVSYPIIIRPQSDWEPGNRMNQAIASLLIAYETVKQTEEGKVLAYYGFNSINGSYLKMGEKSFIRTTLEKNVKYLLMAGGDKSTFDVDIIIKNESKKTVKRDIETDKYAFVTFEPEYDGEYIIELSASGTTEKGFSVLAILQNGIISSTEDIVAAIRNMESRWDKVTGKFKVRFASDPEALDGDYSYRSFCWNGFYVESGSSMGYSANGITPKKNYLLMASGDDNATNIWLSVKYDGREAWDKEHENYPFILFTPKTTKEYDFNTYNKSSSGRAFLVTCLFEMLD